jgi:aminoglycoside phosphotransferase (APT) family kinase protein
VPAPSRVEPHAGWLAHPLLPGVPLLDAGAPVRARLAPATGAVLGRLMAAVAAVPAPPGVDVDDAAPSVWLDEARELHGRLEAVVPAAHRAAVRAFLGEDPPPAAPRAHLVLCHDDLGAEHVLVDGMGMVTGVIDWSDAAVADPAGDLGRILRDLGPAGLDAALAELDPPEPRATRSRAVFRARCGALEDMAYGRDADRPAHLAAAVGALDRLFG